MMTSPFRSTLLAAAVAFAPLTVALHAQTGRTVSVVNVPFDFQNGSKTFPAGVYALVQTSDHILAVKGRNDTGLLMTDSAASGSKLAAASKVVFHRYGSKYFLSEIWRAGQSEHIVCYKTSVEIKAQKTARAEDAANRSAGTVDVALLQPAP